MLRLLFLLYAVNPPCLQRADATANVRVRMSSPLFMRRASVTEALFLYMHAVNPPCLQRADGTANVCVRMSSPLFFERASVTEALFLFMPLIPLVYSGPTVLQTCV